MIDLNISGPEGVFNFAARAVILRKGKILLVKDRLGRYFYLVGGRVQLHESAEHAAQREALEETGANFEAERLLFIHENFFSGNHEVCFFYLMRHIGGDIRAATYSGEELVWLPVDQLGEHMVFPFSKISCGISLEGFKHFVTRE